MPEYQDPYQHRGDPDAESLIDFLERGSLLDRFNWQNELTSDVIDQGGYYNTQTADEISALFEGMELPHFTPPDSAYIKDLEEFTEWQDVGRRDAVHRMWALYNNPPYETAATARNQQYIGDSPGDIGDYFAERGVTPAGQINADIQGSAQTQQSEAQQRIGNKSNQLQLATLERMMQTVGNPGQALQSAATGGLQASRNQMNAAGNMFDANLQSTQFFNQNQQTAFAPAPQQPGFGGQLLGAGLGMLGNAIAPGLGGFLFGS